MGNSKWKKYSYCCLKFDSLKKYTNFQFSKCSILTYNNSEMTKVWKMDLKNMNFLKKQKKGNYKFIESLQNKIF